MVYRYIIKILVKLTFQYIIQNKKLIFLYNFHLTNLYVHFLQEFRFFFSKSLLRTKLEKLLVGSYFLNFCLIVGLSHCVWETKNRNLFFKFKVVLDSALTLTVC